MTQPDKLHYLRIPNGQGARAEAVRMVYVLADRPYVDVFHTFEDAAAAVAGKNPYLQFPFVETPSGEIVYQTIAIMHHAAKGTPAWPTDDLTKALMVALGAYDLYQAFAGFSSTDLEAKKRFEDKRAPKLFGGLDAIYATTPFAVGDAPCFADCLAREAVAWTVRRNDACRGLLEQKKSLTAFLKRFDDTPAIRAFLERQKAARAVDNSV